MAGDHQMAQIHEGMEVKTSDGKTLGRIANVWVGTDPISSSVRCDDEVCSRLEVHLPHRRGRRYIPYSVIAGVSGRSVNLNVDEKTVNERLWHQRPPWLPPEEEDFGDVHHRVPPHTEPPYL